MVLMGEPEGNFPYQTGIIDGRAGLFWGAIINRSKLFLPASWFDNVLRYITNYITVVTTNLNKTFMINACDETTMTHSLPFLKADIILFTSNWNSHIMLNFL